MKRESPRPRFVVPEVVQTSGMDCGPASLKCLLEGFGVPVSYGRLREACQTDVDGTSIDTMEEIAVQLGLEAAQVIVPPDHVLLDDAALLPAIVVVRLPNGYTHFVVAWRSVFGRVQLMDPATGRRWPTRDSFLRDLHLHRMVVSGSAWADHARSASFLGPLRTRLGRLGGSGVATSLVEAALVEQEGRALARLDAVTRMVETLVRSAGLARGAEARSVLETLARELSSCPTDEAEEAIVPASYWFARPAPPDESGEPQTAIRGAVLVRVRGHRHEGAEEAAREGGGVAEGVGPPPLSPELVAALEEPPAHAMRDLVRMLREDGVLVLPSIVLGIAVAAIGTVLEAVLFRALFDVGHHLNVTDKRLWGIVALGVFLSARVLLEVPIAGGTLRMGRRLEGRFRIAFLRKIPRLADRYFQSRPISDMATRNHEVHALRQLPGVGAQVFRGAFALVFTAAGVAWLDPRSGPLAVIVALLSAVLPLSLQRMLTERDLRVQSHAAAIGRAQLDALLGLVPVNAHAAERAVRREHEDLLVEWVRASRSRDRLAIVVDVVQSALAFGLTGWLFLAYFSRVGDPGAALLLLYWAFSLPAHGRWLALVLRRVPALRNIVLRLVEPLGAIERDAEERPPPTPAAAPPENTRSVSVSLREVSVRAGGHTILEGVTLDVAAGEHVAIVGPSGAGKSSLVGLLLGWHRPASGELLVDGSPLVGPRLDALRARTAWVDPAVHLWNRSVIDNIVYGAPSNAGAHVGEIVEHADLQRLLETLPDGLATELGEAGGLVSGGEGQRVRFARAALRKNARLVILDEPFRGLDRERRRVLLDRARRWWPDATLLCITHDVGETREFDRVLVVSGGRIAEDGAPRKLAADPASRYARMLAAEGEVRAGMWTSTTWRRLNLREGRLAETERTEHEVVPTSTVAS